MSCSNRPSRAVLQNRTQAESSRAERRQQTEKDASKHRNGCAERECSNIQRILKCVIDDDVTDERAAPHRKDETEQTAGYCQKNVFSHQLSNNTPPCRANRQ